MPGKLPLFGAGLQGKSAIVTAQNRVNCYAEIQPQGDKSQVAFYGTPALGEPFTYLGNSPIRGVWVLGNYLYAVHRSTLYRVDNNGTQTVLGTLNTNQGWCDISDNGVQIGIVDGTNGYTYNTSSGAFGEISDGDFPDGATSIAWDGGYSIVGVPSTNEFALSTLDDTTAWDATIRASAEGSPDALVRVTVDHGQAILFGSQTTEFWQNTGAQDFPYTRVPGGVIEWGLAAKRSLAKFQSSIIWLGQNRMGQSQVVLLDGYTPRIVSTPELDKIINSGAVSNATGLSYQWYGHPFYQLNVGGRSWLYDGLSGIWSELTFNNAERHRAEMAVNFLGEVVVTDYENGGLYRLSDSVYTDNGFPIVRKLRSRHLQDSEQITISRLWLDFETGVGNADVTDPQIMLRVSKDAGRTYGNERFTSIGRVGEYGKRALFRQLGGSRNWVFEIAYSEPAKFVLTGEGWVE